MWKKIIDKELIVINPKLKTKDELFQKMTNLVYNNDCIINKNKFYNALVEREEMANTEVIDGVAIPHARDDTVEKLFLSIIILENGIDYLNPNLGPVRIVFLIGCSAKQNKEYLQLLAKTARILKKDEFREKLLQAKNRERVVELLSEFSEQEESPREKKNYLMILTLHDVKKSAEVLNSFVESGITNASILEVSSMARKLAYEIPVFAGLSYMAQGKSNQSQIFFSYIEEKSEAYQLQKILRDNEIDLNKKGTGYIQLIAIEQIIGIPEEKLEI